MIERAKIQRRRLLCAALSVAGGASGCGARSSRPVPALQTASAERSPAPSRVVVVGAGLSGLVVAHQLLEAGREVLVLEATARPGGRIRTLRDFAGGHYVEAGATHVLGDPDLMALIRQFDVAESTPERDRRAQRELWGGVLREPGVPPTQKDLDDQRRLDEERARLLQIADRIDPLATTWAPDLLQTDKLSALQWMQGSGASPAVIADLSGMFPGDGPASLSALSALREIASIRREVRGLGDKAQGRIAGGSDRLPMAIAERLGVRIQYRSPVMALERLADRVVVTTQEAHTRQRIEAERVVMTLPFPLLRAMAVAPAWSAAKARAIAEFDMTSVTRVWLSLSDNPWKAGAVSGTATTDLPNGRIKHETFGQPGEGAVLGSYLTGTAARNAAAVGEAEAVRQLHRDSAAVHPEVAALPARGRMVAWDREPYQAGAYAFFRPRQLTELFEHAIASEGRVHFAGDGTSYRPGFMHGAVASAKRVVDEILRAQRP